MQAPRTAPVKRTLPVAIALLAGTSAIPVAHAWDPVADAFTTTAKVKLNFRARYEAVDDASPTLEDAEAATLRSRITYETGAVEGFSLLLEADDVTALMPQDYNDGVNGKTRYTAIQDPEGSEINQAALSYAGLPGTVLKFGRQRIALDNERFVGGVAWRQNEQTFDAVSLSNTSLPDTTVFYANINNVNRILGEDSPSGDHEHDSHIVNLKYAGIPGLTVSGYGYLLDNQDNAEWSSDTVGARVAGKHPFGDASLKYALEYARQQGAHDNPYDYEADYGLAEIGYGTSLISATVGIEILGADDHPEKNDMPQATGRGFQTTLATLHKFQGWADQFLNGGTGNLNTGIEDRYLALEGLALGLQWGLNYHEYEAAEATPALDELGSEWGASVEKKFDNYSAALKYASYEADDFSYDKDKLWFTLQAQF